MHLVLINERSMMMFENTLNLIHCTSSSPARRSLPFDILSFKRQQHMRVMVIGSCGADRAEMPVLRQRFCILFTSPLQLLVTP